MNTIAFIGAGLVLVLVILAKLPGLEHTVRPMIDMVFKGLQAVIENGFSWGIWLFKVLWSAHIELAQHLMFSAEAMDPTVAIREQSDEPT